MCRGSKSLFQLIRPHQRSYTIIFILFAYGFGNIDPRIGLIQLLTGKFMGKNREKIFRLKWFVCLGVQRGQRFVDHICLNIVPLSWDFTLRKEKTFLFRTHCIVDYLTISLRTCYKDQLATHLNRPLKPFLFPSSNGIGGSTGPLCAR